MARSSLHTERVLYVSWIDRRTDPWPNWEFLQPGQGSPSLEGQPVEFLPPDHPEWPGMPFVRGVHPLRLSDGRMGRFSWPGIPLADGSGRLYVGPTLSALFHRGSHRPLAQLERIFLLYQSDREGGPQQCQVLRNTLQAIGQARHIHHLAQRIVFQPISGLEDPTDYPAIIQALNNWLDDDPFGLGSRRSSRQPASLRIVVNISPGTAAMSACWLLLRWSGALGGSQSTVEFVQGDGGLDARDRPDDPTYNPLRIVPVDILALVRNDKPAPVTAHTPDFEFRTSDLEEEVYVEGLQGQPYDRLRQEIEQAACLGLPILLEGERGTGKTSLAEFYHQRRRFYRNQQPEGSPRKSPPQRPAPGPRSRVRFPAASEENQFVKVTLSEYADLDTLRDTLFGWAKGSWTGAEEAYDGLLGEAHRGTLFLDEIHHLDRKLQPLLLGPLNTDSLNSRRYKPKMATYEIISDFDLVVATNDPLWRDKMIPDLQERFERIVLQVPSFRSFQQQSPQTIWQFWNHSLRRRCQSCRIAFSEEGEWTACSQKLLELFRTNPLTGNWRDLQRLADNVLLHLSAAREGRPTGLLWSLAGMERAVQRTFRGER
jgi:hypothetical protein